MGNYITGPPKFNKNIIKLYYVVLQVACVVHCGLIDGENSNMFISGPEGNLISRDQLKASFLLRETFIDLLFSFSTRFNQFELMQSEVALFSALMLITPGTTIS